MKQPLKTIEDPRDLQHTRMPPFSKMFSSLLFNMWPFRSKTGTAHVLFFLKHGDHFLLSCKQV